MTSKRFFANKTNVQRVYSRSLEHGILHHLNEDSLVNRGSVILKSFLFTQTTHTTGIFFDVPANSSDDSITNIRVGNFLL